ncbi:hypothetical protein ACE6H2_020423 [Prunus campanulata]
MIHEASKCSLFAGMMRLGLFIAVGYLRKYYVLFSFVVLLTLGSAFVYHMIK